MKQRKNWKVNEKINKFFISLYFYDILYLKNFLYLIIKKYIYYINILIILKIKVKIYNNIIIK